MTTYLLDASVAVTLCLFLEAPFVTAEKTTTPWVVKLGDRARLVSAA